MKVIGVIAPIMAFAIIGISIITMVIKANRFKKTIRDTIQTKKTIEETITAKAKAQLEEALKENQNLTCEYCGTACNKDEKKCSSCGSTLKR